MNVSQQNAAILLLDNRALHVSIEIFDLACEHGVAVVTYPLHCNHQMQPLDVTIYGTFKQIYSSTANSWELSNPGEGLTIHDDAGLSRKAFYQASTPANTTARFHANGLCPYIRDGFDGTALVPEFVTN